MFLRVDMPSFFDVNKMEAHVAQRVCPSVRMFKLENLTCQSYVFKKLY